MSKKRSRSKSVPKKKRATWRRPISSRFPTISQRPAGANAAYVDFIYTSKFTLDAPTLGAATVYQFRLNSLFDPDLTGVGTQPVGFDQYAALYEKYRVYEASYKLMVNNSNGTRPVIAGVMACDQDTATTDLDRLVQNGQAQWTLMGPAGSSTDTVAFKGTVDIAAAQGVTKQAFWDDDLNEAVMTANPVEAYVLNCFLADANISDPGGCNCFIEIRYRARLYGNQLVVVS